MLLLALTLCAADVDVFTSGQDGYHTYRIPAIIATKKRTLLAFAEGRRHSGRDYGDIDTLVKRSRDGGRTWSPAITVADFGDGTIGNPAPVLDRNTGAIWLLLTSNPGDVAEKAIEPGLTGHTRTVWVTYSQDDGLTWASPRDITASVKLPGWTWYATGPVNGIQLKSGRLVIPCDHNRGDSSQRYSHVIYSDDHGATWKLGGSAGPHGNESTVAELTGGVLMLNQRSYAGKNRRQVSLSRDGGLTWTDPALDEALIEPVCQGSLLRIGKHLYFANPASAKRERMTVKRSEDNGKTWTSEQLVHPGPAAYSNLIGLQGGRLGLLYERGEKGPYERIVFTSFAYAAIGRPPSPSQPR